LEEIEMEVCWCGCGAEWAPDTAWDWAATDEWSDYAEPVYEEAAYYEPIVYTDPFVTESIIYTEPLYTEPVYTEPAYTEPVYTEPYVEAAPMADPGIVLVGGPTAGFEPVAIEPAPEADPALAVVGGPTAAFEPVMFDQAPVADASVAIVGGPTAGVPPAVFVSEAAVVTNPSGNVAVIGGEPLGEYELPASDWTNWELFLNNRGADTSGDPIADLIISNNLSLEAMRRSEIDMSNAGTYQTTWGTPASDFSYNSSGRLVNNPYYNDFKPL
jgi:hypothetical protein